MAERLSRPEYGWWAKRRAKTLARRGWYPRWLWPALAMPGTVWMLVLFVWTWAEAVHARASEPDRAAALGG